MRPPSVHLIQGIVLAVGQIGFTTVVVDVHNVDAIYATLCREPGDGKVALPVKGEEVAPVRDGTDDEGVGVVLGVGLCVDDFLEVVPDGRVVVLLYMTYANWFNQQLRAR